MLIYILGCIFFPEVLRHKVLPSPAGSLLTTSGEQVSENRADNREVDYSKLLATSEDLSLHCLLPQLLQHSPAFQGHRKNVKWFKCFEILRAKAQWKSIQWKQKNHVISGSVKPATQSLVAWLLFLLPDRFHVLIINSPLFCEQLRDSLFFSKDSNTPINTSRRKPHLRICHYQTQKWWQWMAKWAWPYVYRY